MASDRSLPQEEPASEDRAAELVNRVRNLIPWRELTSDEVALVKERGAHAPSADSLFADDWPERLILPQFARHAIRNRAAQDIREFASLAPGAGYLINEVPALAGALAKLHSPSIAVEFLEITLTNAEILSGPVEVSGDVESSYFGEFYSADLLSAYAKFPHRSGRAADATAVIDQALALPNLYISEAVVFRRLQRRIRGDSFAALVLANVDRFTAILEHGDRVSPALVGLPDLVCFDETELSRVTLVEGKVGRERLSPAQEAWAEYFIAEGVDYGVARFS